MKPTLNLATRTYLNRPLLYASYGFVAVALALALAAGALYGWDSYRDMAALEAQAEALEGTLAALNRPEEQAVTPAAYARLQERIAFANGVLLKDAFRWTELLDKLETVVPAGVGLRDILPEFRDGSLRINGLARNLGTLQEFLDNLLASPYFSAVLLLNQERVDPEAGGGIPALSFTVVLKGAF